MTGSDRMRFERQVQHLHTLGCRPVGELLVAFAEAVDGHELLAEMLDGYDRLSPEMVRAAGGDRFPVCSPRDVPPDLLARSAA